MSDLVEHGTHLEALAWAATWAPPGAVLEVGSGWWSTPWLHGWAAGMDRWLLTIETEPPWARTMQMLFGDERHEIRELPRGRVELPTHFGLAFVDGINEDRAAWVRALFGTGALVVVHDTDDTRIEEFPGLIAEIERYAIRRDFDRLFPRTTVVWGSNG